LVVYIDVYQKIYKELLTKLEKRNKMILVEFTTGKYIIANGDGLW
jgi:hypothetical protein